MHLDEDDLKDIRRKGAKVRTVNGESLKPLPEPPPPADAALRAIPASIRELAEALVALAKHESAHAPVSAAAPHITVEAPDVTVKPEINVNSAREWEAIVTERDSAGRTYKIRLKAIG